MESTQSTTESKKSAPLANLRGKIAEQAEAEFDELDEQENLAEQNNRYSSAGKTINEEVRKIEEDDVFVIGNDYAENGLAVQYRIKKDDRVVKHVDGSYSWRELHEDFPDGGNFKVTASLPEKPRHEQYLKTQSLRLGRLQKEDRSEKDYAKHAQDVSMTQKELLEILSKRDQTADEKTERLQKEKEELMMKMFDKNQQSGNESILTQLGPILEALKPKESGGDKTFDFMMQMQDKQAQQQEKNFNMMMEMMKQQQEAANNRFLEMSQSIKDAVTTKEDTKGGFDPVEHMKLISDAEQRGFDRYKDMMDLIELKASEKAEKDKPESHLDSLMKNFAPLLSTIISKGSAPQTAPAPQNPTNSSTAYTNPRSEQERRARIEYNQEHEAAARASQNPKKKKIPSAADLIKQRQEQSLTQEEKKEAQKQALKEVSVEDMILKGEVNQENSQAIIQTIIPILFDSINSNEENITVISTRCLKAIHEAKIDLRTVERDLTLKVIDDLIEEYGSSYDTIKQHASKIRELHGSLTRQIRSALGQLLENQKHEVAQGSQS